MSDCPRCALYAITDAELHEALERTLHELTGTRALLEAAHAMIATLQGERDAACEALEQLKRQAKRAIGR